MTGDSRTDLDLARVLADIDEEVRLRRASGDLPPGFDRELDDLFERLTPTDLRSDDFSVAADRAEEAAFIDVDVPTASRIPGGSLAKWLLAKLIRWFANHLAQQTTVFATAASRAIRLLGQRVDLLEGRVQALEQVPVAERARIAGERRPPHSPPDLSDWAEPLAGLLAGRSGRVAHVECGTGSLVARLVELGIDAYGVEPVEDHVAAAVRRYLEVRLDDAPRHLRHLSSGSLAGLVLSGCVERLPVAGLLDLADQSARVVAPGGVLMVISSTPEAWGRHLAPVEADLAEGRPLHPDTWEVLLGSRGFTAVATSRGAAAPPLEPMPADLEGAAVLNTNLERISQALFAPAIYAVTAVRTDAPPPAPR